MKPNTLSARDQQVAAKATAYATTVRFKDRQEHATKEAAEHRLEQAGSGCLYAVAELVEGYPSGALVATYGPRGWQYIPCEVA